MGMDSAAQQPVWRAYIDMACYSTDISERAARMSGHHCRVSPSLSFRQDEIVCNIAFDLASEESLILSYLSFFGCAASSPHLGSDL